MNSGYKTLVGQQEKLFHFRSLYPAKRNTRLRCEGLFDDVEAKRGLALAQPFYVLHSTF